MKRLLLAGVLLLCGLRGWASSLKDPSWTSGQLENGLRYFIRPNAEPKGRIELRLAVNVGSIQEEDDQQGLAHYLEHMAFNGTTNFEKDALVAFLESLGVAFGPELNAYTSFDETVYMLRLPTDDPAVVDKAFLVLADWAGEISNTDEALETERGVILEERRVRRGAETRIRDQQYPLIFPNSRYAERLPIGTLEVIENFEFDRLREYYRDWYRPELMSIVAVGDLDVEETRKRIETHFNALENQTNAPERVEYPHPAANEERAGMFTDPELTGSDIVMIWNHPPERIETEEAYITLQKEKLVVDMLNQRFQEISLQAEAPFLGAGCYAGGFTRAGNVFLLQAGVADEPGALLEGGRALMIELARAKQFGFTEGEVQRAVARSLRAAEARALEKDKTDSGQLARRLVRHSLQGELVLSPEQSLDLMRESLPTLTAEKALAILTRWVDTPNVVVMAEAPEKDDGVPLPTEPELLSLLSSAQDQELTPYEDALADAPLIAAIPEPGQIVSRETNEALGLSTWVLSNGARIIYKSTDFKQDEVLISAWGPGGSVQASAEEWPGIRMADAVAAETGMGPFSVTDLGKLLSGKKVNLEPYIQADQQGFRAMASPSDLETLMKLIHLRFTTVRADEEAFLAMQKRLRASLQNKEADPKAVFNDLFTEEMSNHHPRIRPMTLADVDQLDMQASLDFFQRCFANAGVMTFFIVGNVEEETLEPLATQWLASLPGSPAEQERSYLDTDFPRFELSRTLRQGVEPISEVRMVWSSEDFEWSYASRHALQSMMGALRNRLREEIREEEGGSYHVSAFPMLRHYPTPRKQVMIRFGCDPERVEELIARVQSLVEEMSTTPLDESYIEIVQQTQLRRRETDLRENSFWEFVIPFYDWHGEDPEILLEFDQYVEGITPESIRQAAADIFGTEHTAIFTLRPGEESNE